jgi:hypothetical protein
VLTTDTVKGLQLTLTSCSVPWSATYTCSGTSTQIASGPAVGNFVLPSTAASMTPGGTDHLVYTLTLPTSADNTFQGKSATLSLVFSGTQRAATTR